MCPLLGLVCWRECSRPGCLPYLVTQGEEGPLADSGLGLVFRSEGRGPFAVAPVVGRPDPVVGGGQQRSCGQPGDRGRDALVVDKRPGWLLGLVSREVEELSDERDVQLLKLVVLVVGLVASVCAIPADGIYDCLERLAGSRLGQYRANPVESAPVSAAAPGHDRDEKFERGAVVVGAEDELPPELVVLSHLVVKFVEHVRAGQRVFLPAGFPRL